MTTYSINDIFHSTDRYKIFTLMCSTDQLINCISYIQSEKINVINIGKELSLFIESIEDYKYLNIDVYDHVLKLLEKHKSQAKGAGNSVIAIYNFGILLEPSLELNAVQLLKEFAKSASLIIIWENQSDFADKLNWLTQNQNFFFDFSDAPLKKLQHAI